MPTDGTYGMAVWLLRDCVASNAVPYGLLCPGNACHWRILNPKLQPVAKNISRQAMLSLASIIEVTLVRLNQ